MKKIDGALLARIVSAKAFENYSNSDPLTVSTDGITYAVTGIIDRDGMSLDELNSLLEQIEEVDE